MRVSALMKATKMRLIHSRGLTLRGNLWTNCLLLSVPSISLCPSALQHLFLALPSLLLLMLSQLPSPPLKPSSPSSQNYQWRHEVHINSFFMEQFERQIWKTKEIVNNNGSRYHNKIASHIRKVKLFEFRNSMIWLGMSKEGDCRRYLTSLWRSLMEEYFCLY